MFCFFYIYSAAEVMHFTPERVTQGGQFFSEQKVISREIFDVDFSMKNLSDDTVSKVVEALSHDYKDDYIKLFLGQNNIGDSGLSKIVQACNDNNIKLYYVGLQNNRVTKTGLLDLLKKYPDVMVDLQVNYINIEDLRSVFTTINGLDSTKIHI